MDLDVKKQPWLQYYGYPSQGTQLRYSNLQTYLEFYRNQPTFLGLYQWIYRNVKLQEHASLFAINKPKNPTDQNHHKVFSTFLTGSNKDTSYARNAYLVGQCFGEGPKVFKITPDAAEALAQMEVSLSFEDYQQPYETCIVELPRAYSIRNATVLPTDVGEGFTQDERNHHYPIFVILHRLPKDHDLLIHVQFASDRFINSGLLKEGTIEEALIHQFRDYPWDPTDSLSNDESQVCLWCARVAFNTMLIAEGEGHHSTREFASRRDSTEAKVARLEKQRKLQPLERTKLQQLRSELNTLPTYFELNQNIVFSNNESQEEGPTREGSHSSKKPHWRRGHWKMQPYGPQSSLRKRIRIIPTKVNWHLFKGQDQDVTVNYKVK